MRRLNSIDKGKNSCNNNKITKSNYSINKELRLEMTVRLKGLR